MIFNNWINFIFMPVHDNKFARSLSECSRCLFYHWKLIHIIVSFSCFSSIIPCEMAKANEERSEGRWRNRLIRFVNSGIIVIVCSLPLFSTSTFFCWYCIDRNRYQSITLFTSFSCIGSTRFLWCVCVKSPASIIHHRPQNILFMFSVCHGISQIFYFTPIQSPVLFLVPVLIDEFVLLLLLFLLFFLFLTD